MTNKKVASEIAVGIILLITIVIGGIFWVQNKESMISDQVLVENQEPAAQTPAEKEGVLCTQDAKLCDDGSYVSRTGPKCEFSACPTVNEDGDQSTEFMFEAPADWQTYKNDKYAFELKYPKGWVAKIEQWKDMPGEDSGRLGFIYIGKAPIGEKKEISGDIWKNGYPLEDLKNPGPVVSSKEIMWKREGIKIIEIDSIGQDINGDYKIRNFILYSDTSNIVRLGCEKKDIDICTNIVSTLKFVE